MSAKGGLPAIPVYVIERGHYLHELRQVRAKERVHEKSFNFNRKACQKMLCKVRESYYGQKSKRAK